MNSYPREPNTGDRISAQLIRDIIRCLRRITPLAGPGVKLAVTPNGTHVSCEASAGSSSAKKDVGCWIIGSKEKTSGGEEKKCFENRYYQIGGKLYQLASDVFLEDVIGAAVTSGSIVIEQGEGEAEADLCVGLEISMVPSTFGTAEVKAYPSFAQMALKSSDTLKYVKPLYEIGSESLKVKTDFRNMPLLAAAEMPGETNLESGGSGSGGSGS